jgi:hypothetical protein
MSGAASEIADDRGNVNQGMAHLSVAAEADIGRKTAKGSIDRSEKGSRGWQDPCSVLEPSGD